MGRGLEHAQGKAAIATGMDAESMQNKTHHDMRLGVRGHFLPDEFLCKTKSFNWLNSADSVGVREMTGSAAEADGTGAFIST